MSPRTDRPSQRAAILALGMFLTAMAPSQAGAGADLGPDATVSSSDLWESGGDIHAWRAFLCNDPGDALNAAGGGLTGGVFGPVTRDPLAGQVYGSTRRQLRAPFLDVPFPGFGGRRTPNFTLLPPPVGGEHPQGDPLDEDGGGGPYAGDPPPYGGGGTPGGGFDGGGGGSGGGGGGGGPGGDGGGPPTPEIPPAVVPLPAPFLLLLTACGGLVLGRSASRWRGR